MLLDQYRKGNLLFPEHIRRMRALAKSHRKYFLSFDWIKQKKEHPYRFLTLIRAYYWLFLFFPDPEIRARFRQFGLSNFEMQWFTSIEEVIDEFDVLENEKEMFVWRTLTLGIMKDYLEIKIDSTLVPWASSNFPHDGFIKLQNLPKNFLRTATWELKSPDKYQRAYSTRVRELYDSITKQMDDKNEFDDFFSKAAKGKVDDLYIQNLISYCFIPKPFTKTVKSKTTTRYMTQNEYLWRISKILLLITKRDAMIPLKEENIYIKKESNGVRMDTILSLKKIIRDLSCYNIPKYIGEHWESL